MEGLRIRERPGHIKDHPQFDSKRIFASPSIIYAGLIQYAEPESWKDPTDKKRYRVRVAFQIFVQPGSYKVGQETVNAGGRVIDPLFSNSELEWSTDRQGSTILYGLLINLEANGEGLGFGCLTSKPSLRRSFGCRHYERKCAIVSPCCEKIYTCRRCHNEIETHQLNRKLVKKLQCLNCGIQQPVSQNCQNCGVVFGRYFCNICNLFEDRDEKIFHCFLCGECRVGPRELTFHCPACNKCWASYEKDNHQCVANMSPTNRGACNDYL